MPFAERRKYPRITQAVPCQLRVGPSLLQAETKNLSCGGFLCRLSTPLALMTKLAVALELPGKTPRPIRCIGVVVRRESHEDREEPSRYWTAIYFSQLKSGDRQRIAEFVLQSMLSKGVF